MLDEIATEARRLDRSMSWIVQRACAAGDCRIEAASVIEPQETKETAGTSVSETSNYFFECGALNARPAEGVMHSNA
jgi:hypothetical protein